MHSHKLVINASMEVPRVKGKECEIQKKDAFPLFATGDFKGEMCNGFLR